MIAKYFLGMKLFGGRHFDSDSRKKFVEEWEKMPDSEKLEIINKRLEAFKEGKDCEREFFSVEHIDAHCQEWMNKSREEKEEFVAEIKEMFEERHAMMHKHFSHHGFDRFHGRGQRDFQSNGEE